LIYTPETETRGTNISGNFSGFLTKSGSPYYVTDNLTIPWGAFLDIRPGVVIKFDKDAILYINGDFWANGTKSDPIIFAPNTPTPYIGYWQGIKMYLTGYIRMSYCQISYAHWGINAEIAHELEFERCEIFKCGNATEFSTVSNVTMENCNLYDNLHYGINATDYCAIFDIMNNTIYNNRRGIRLYRTFVSNIYNNSIFKHRFKGLELRSSRLLIVRDNIINSTGPGASSPVGWFYENVALHMNRTYECWLQNNKLLDTNGFGLLMNRSSFNLLENNQIENTTQTGIHLASYCGYNRFLNHTIRFIRKSKIILGKNCIENYFKNNSMIKGSKSYAVQYGENSYTNYFEPDNMVNGLVIPIFYKVASDTLNTSLKDLTITDPIITNLGQVVIVNCENFTINNCEFNKGIAGLFLYDSHNVTISKSKMKDNKYGFYFGFNSTNVLITNSTIENAKTKDIYLDSYANITILNSTFNKNKIVNRVPSNLRIQWFMHVKVFYGLGAQEKAIKGANIKVSDKLNELVSNGSTNANGIISFIKCTEMVKSDIGITYFTKHNVSAFKMHYQPGYAGTGIVMDSSKWVTVRLRDNRDPKLSGQIEPSVTHNPRPKLLWSAGIDADHDPLKYWIQIWNVKDSGTIIEQTTVGKTKYTLQTNLSYGERYWISINASDPYGGWSENLTGTLDIINNPPSKPDILIAPLQTSREPNRNRDLNCTIIKPSEDLDINPKDKIKYHYFWYKNNELQTHLSVWNTTKSYNLLSHDHTSTGEEWTCEVYVTDGIDTIGPVTDSRFIRNTPPDIIPPKHVYMDEDSIDFTSIDLDKIFRDLDGDKLTYSFSITGNNISLTLQPDNTVLIVPNPDWSGYELARFTANDGEESVQTVIKITVLPIPDPPVADIVWPMDNQYKLFNETDGIRFEGLFKDPDLLFGDVLNLTWQSDVEGIIGHTAILSNVILPVGEHKIDFIVRDRQGNTAIDSIEIIVYDKDNPPPDITFIRLISPFYGQVVQNSTVTLFWEPENLTRIETESMLFDIYLYKEGEPQELIVEKYVGTNITLPILDEDVIYYWTIVPFRNNTQGVCLSGIWQFQVIPGLEFIFDMKLSMNASKINLKAGESDDYYLKVRNNGNVPDKFEISISFTNNSRLSDYLMVEKVKFTLRSKHSRVIKITFDLPKNFSDINLTDTMVITVNTELGDLGKDLQKDVLVTGFVKPKPKIPPEVEKEAPADLMEIFLVILIVLIIILFLVIIFTVVLKNSLKNSLKLNYPLKDQKIIKRERKLKFIEIDKETSEFEDEPVIVEEL
jgi:parallel beta-helix repeat protein